MSNYVIRQEKFEGPLELLLELIGEEKLAITEISLGRVTDDYLRYVRGLAKIDPEQLAEFLIVAAQLMLIKSRTLLSNLTFSEEEEVSIEDLERRLREYQKIREIAKSLRNLESSGKKIITREAFLGVQPIFYPSKKLSSTALKEVFCTFLEALPKIEKLAEEKIKRIISLEEKINNIRNFLTNSIERVFSEIVHGTKEKVEVIVSFLAILELARQQFVDLKQEKLFSEIRIRKIM